MMLKIDDDHWIAGVRRVSTNNHSGKMVELPILVVMHYTASGSAQSAINWFSRKDGSASAHIIIDRSGNIVQMLPFNYIAWHAGKSQFGNRDRCNLFSIGIELVNWGMLTNHDGEFRSHAYTIVSSDDVIECDGKYWQKFTKPQIDIALCVVRSICVQYPIEAVVGHSEIARPVGRKIDPGPLFPMSDFRKLVEKRS